MSVAEGREVIVIYMQKIRPVISGAIHVNFFSTEHHGIMTQADRADPGQVGFGVECTPNLLRVSFCIVVQAS